MNTLPIRVPYGKQQKPTMKNLNKKVIYWKDKLGANSISKRQEPGLSMDRKQGNSRGTRNKNLDTQHEAVSAGLHTHPLGIFNE